MPRDPGAEPKVDWLRALVLERMQEKDICQRTLAEHINYSYATTRRYMMKHPQEWTREFRNAVFRTLGISVKRLPESIQKEILLYQVEE